MKDQDVYLKHIIEAIDKIKAYTKGMNLKDFLTNNLVKDAVVRNIEIIGEATKNLSEDFRKEHKEVAWKDIAGMRDRIAHFYFGLDYELVWEVVVSDLPKLEADVLKILKR